MKVAHLLLASLGAFALWTSAASAQTAAIEPVAISADLQHDLTDKLGEREADILRAMLTRQLTWALEREGVTLSADGEIRIAAEILDADPNRPTFRELTRNTSLSFADSVSTGGANLRATLTGPHGPQEVAYRYHTASLEDVIGEPNTWTDADRAMRVFAQRVARAAKQQAH